MKIIFTADSHVFYGDQRKAVRDMMDKIKKQQPDVVCIAGDIGEVLVYEDLSLVQELFSIQPTLFILGNHCLYTSDRRYNPPEAMLEVMKKLRWGIPLQKYWTDATTVYEKDNCLFLGAIGFPCFSHPKMIMPIKYYDLGCPTVDGIYMNLKGGWLQYTQPLMEAFEKKLKLIDKSKCKNIVIISHYPCYESQYKLNPTEDISVYFYNHKLGLMIKEVADRNIDKKFYVISGHGHNFNVGQWVAETPNLTTMGFVTDYNRQNYISLEFPAITD